MRVKANLPWANKVRTEGDKGVPLNRISEPKNANPMWMQLKRLNKLANLNVDVVSDLMKELMTLCRRDLFIPI
jgi:hypothetical protein